MFEASVGFSLIELKIVESENEQNLPCLKVLKNFSTWFSFFHFSENANA